MKTFEYKGYATDGRPRNGLIEADDVKDARRRLAQTGILSESVQAVAPDDAKTSSSRGRFPLDIRTMFYRELAALTRSGVALVPALDVILQAPELAGARGVLAGIRDEVREGLPLSTALARASKAVTPFEQSIVEVGERTGGMDDALSRLATFLEEQEKLRDKVVSALLYPCVVVVLAALLGALVLVFMLPMVQRLFAEANIAPPLMTTLILSGGRLLGILLLLLLAGGLAASIFWRKRFQRDAPFALRVDRRFYSLPIAGRMWRILTSLRFVRVLALLLERGVGLMDALPMAGKASGSPWLAQSAARETEAMGQGKPLAEAIRGMEPLSPSLAAWVQAGEAGGRLIELLDNAAQRLQQIWERLTARGMVLLEIGLTLVMGVFVLLIALAVLLPIMQMNKGIGL